MLLLYDEDQSALCLGGNRVASYGLGHELSRSRRLAVGASPRAVEAQLTASG